MDSAEELTFQDSAFIQTAKQPCGAADLPEQRRGPSLPTSSLASSMAAAAEEQALVVAADGSGGVRLASDIARDVTQMLEHDGLLEAGEVTGAGAPRLAIHRVTDGSDDDVVEIEVVHKIRAHLRHKPPSQSPSAGASEQSSLAEELAATAAQSQGSSRSSLNDFKPGSGCSSLAAEAAAALAAAAAADPSAAPTVLHGGAHTTLASRAGSGGSGSASTPSLRDRSMRQLSAVGSNLSLMAGSPAPQSLQPLAGGAGYDQSSQQAQQQQAQPSSQQQARQQQQGAPLPCSPFSAAAPADTLAAVEAWEQQRAEELLVEEQQRRAATDAALAPYEIDPRDVLVGERLAVGGFAEVFVGQYQGTLVAIKLLLSVDERGQERFRAEVETVAALRHPNIVLFMGCCTQPYLAIVSEFMHRGSLFKLLRHGGNKPLEPKLQRSVAISVARGMAYLHTRSPPFLHLDLKSANILLDDRLRVKIADFGLSRVRSRTLVSGTGAGTPEWMAPEVLRSEGYDEHADVYSYGVVLWEVLTGQQPWAGLHAMQVVGAVGFQNKSLPSPTEGDPFLIGLCLRCLAPDPRSRPLFPQIVQELEQHYSRGHSFASLGSHHTLSQGTIQLDTSDATAAARAGGARELPTLPAPPPPSLHGPPGLRLPARAVPRSGSKANRGQGGAGTRAYGGHESTPFQPEPGSPGQVSPFASAHLPYEQDGEEVAATQKAQQAQQQAEPQPPAPTAVQLHPAASMTNDSPFASLAPFGDSDEEEGAAAVQPRLDGIPEAASGSLSAAPTSSSTGGDGTDAGERTEASLSERLRLFGLDGSEMGSSLEEPMQSQYLGAITLARATTLQQHLEETAAARPAAPAVRLARQRSARELSPSARQQNSAAKAGSGSGPASVDAVGLADAKAALLHGIASSRVPPSFPSVTEAAAWCSLDDAAL